MKELEFEDMETPEGRFTKLMMDYTELKQQRLILLHGELHSVSGLHLDYLPPLGDATISLIDDHCSIDGQMPPDLEQKIRRSARRLHGLLLQVNTFWLEQAISQLSAMGADGNLNLDAMTEFTTVEKALQAEQFEAQLVKKMIKPRGET
jgi:hypothetical protein